MSKYPNSTPYGRAYFPNFFLVSLRKENSKNGVSFNKGITVRKIVIWGGESSDSWSEISTYGDALAEP